MSKGPNETDVLVGARVRLLRIELGLSQTQLANALGVTFQQVQKYEKKAATASAPAASTRLRKSCVFRSAISFVTPEKRSTMMPGLAKFSASSGFPAQWTF